MKYGIQKNFPTYGELYNIATYVYELMKGSSYFFLGIFKSIEAFWIIS